MSGEDWAVVILATALLVALFVCVILRAGYDHELAARRKWQQVAADTIQVAADAAVAVEAAVIEIEAGWTAADSDAAAWLGGRPLAALTEWEAARDAAKEARDLTDDGIAAWMEEGR